MEKNRRKKVVLRNIAISLGIIIAVFLGLCILGLLSASLVIEIPRNDVKFEVKSMTSEDLTPILVDKETFKEIKLDGKVVFLDTNFENGRFVRVWCQADGAAFYYQEELKGYPLFQIVSDIDFKFTGLNQIEILLKR